MNSRSANHVVATALAEFTHSTAAPIIWHDRTKKSPKRIYGATCFFLRFPDKIIGVTADHVVEAFNAALKSNGNIVCQIRTSEPIDLVNLIIDRCPDRDIATFSLPDDVFATLNAVPIDCSYDWPPPVPDIGRVVTFCGFPEEERTTPEIGVVEAFVCGALTTIEDVTERDLIVAYDPKRDVAAPWAPWEQPLGYNMSGCSGGPVLMHGDRKGLHRWFIVAMVIRGPNGAGKGDAGAFDIITLRRIDAIQPNGKIKQDPVGWLP